MSDQAQAARDHAEVIARGDHLLQRMGLRDVDRGEGWLSIEMDLHPEVGNTRGALQGGLIAAMIDVVAGRLAQSLVPEGYGTATADLSVHYLAPVTVGPGRAEATVVRNGRRSIVVRAEVTDVGTGRLATIATVSFAVLAPR